MLLKIIEAGDDCLRKVAAHVTPTQLKSDDTQRLIDLMIATLRDKPGVGLAAPQVGESLQIIVIEDKKEYQKKVPE
jgi:peptide deformylase